MSASQQTGQGEDAANSGGGMGEALGSGNIDKIRDILFGNQMREYQSRFTKLESSLSKEVASLRDETRKRLDTLELYIRQEVDSLSERLTAEKASRQEQDDDLNTSLKDNVKSLNRKLGQQAEEQAKSSRDQRQRLLEQSNSQSDDLSRTREELKEALENTTNLLQHVKVDRAALSDLFSEFAMRITGDLAGELAQATEHATDE